MKIIPFLLILIVFFSCSKKENIVKRPNFIFIYSDDQRFDAAGFNHNKIILTPELDKMAAQGIRFTSANVVFSLCSPSRAALLTGRYGSANGVLQLSSNLNAGEKTIADYLQEAGYQTAQSGKWHIGQKPGAVGFGFHVYFEGNGDYYNRKIFDNSREVVPEMHCDEYCVNRSIDFLKEAAKSDRPFFLFHNTQLPHMNHKLVWDAKAETKEKYNPAEMPVAISRFDDLSEKPAYLKKVRNIIQAKVYGYPDSVAIQNHTRDYYSVITEMDQALGRLFQAIDDLGLRENTYIFFMSDNGWMLGEHGFTSKVLPYRPSSSVPLFILGPGIKPGHNDSLVLNIDMAPTILQLAGVEIPGAIHGKSMVPLLQKTESKWRKAFVYEGLGNYGGTLPNLTVVSRKYRYIETYSNENLDTLIYRELYDQIRDPEEMNNLVMDSSAAEVIKEMAREVKDHKIKILNKTN